MTEIAPETQSAVSVIVCTQGRQPLLSRGLAALARQSNQTIEILLVTDADPESVGAVVPHEAKLFTRVVSEPAKGLNRKRNRGVREARSELLLFTDDDCIPDVAWVEAAVGALGQHSVVTGRILPLNDGYRASIRTRESPRLYGRSWLDRVFAWSVGCGNNMAVRRSVFDDYGPFREDLGVGTWSGAACDTEFFFRVMTNGGSVFYEPEAIVRHHQPEDPARIEDKRRGYYRGVSYMARCVHPRSAAAWTMALTRVGGSAALCALAALTLRRQATRQHLAELRGAVEGFWPPAIVADGVAQ